MRQYQRELKADECALEEDSSDDDDDDESEDDCNVRVFST
jgi:hypothetical protein